MPSKMASRLALTRASRPGKLWPHRDGPAAGDGLRSGALPDRRTGGDGARREGRELRHVKPHGMLYNQAAKDPALAEAIARAVRDVDPQLILVGLAGSELIRAGERLGADHPPGSVCRSGLSQRWQAGTTQQAGRVDYRRQCRRWRRRWRWCGPGVSKVLKANMFPCRRIRCVYTAMASMRSSSRAACGQRLLSVKRAFWSAQIIMKGQ